MDVIDIILMLLVLALVAGIAYVVLRATGVVAAPGSDDDIDLDDDGVALTDEEKRKRDLEESTKEAEEDARDVNEFSKFIGNNKVLLLTAGATALIVKRIAQKLAKRKVAKNVAKKTAKAATARIANKGGAKALVKTGSMTLNRAATIHGKIVAKRVGSEAGKQAGEASGKLAAKLFLKKMSKFFVTLGRGLVRFDLVSFSLDIADLFLAGPGYAHMGNKQSFYAMQGEIYKDVEQVYKEAGEKYPVVAGPFDKIDPETLAMEIEGRTRVYLNKSDNKYQRLVLAKVEKQKFNNGAEAVKGIDQIIDEVYTDQAYDEITTTVLNQLCVDKGGKIVDGDKCSYRDRNACINSYIWPLTDDDLYAEWKDGKCLLASSEMRKYCSAIGLGYDIDKGICEINQAYCIANEADFLPNPKLCDYNAPYMDSESYYTGPKTSDNFFTEIKERASEKPKPRPGCTPERDCMLTDAQFWTELVVGTTVSRGARDLGGEVVNLFEQGELKEGQHDGWLRVKDRRSGESNKQWLDRIANEIVDPSSLPDSTQPATTDEQMKKRGQLWPLEKVNGRVRLRENPAGFAKSKYINQFYSPGTGPN